MAQFGEEAAAAPDSLQVSKACLDRASGPGGMGWGYDRVGQCGVGMGVWGWDEVWEGWGLEGGHGVVWAFGVQH